MKPVEPDIRRSSEIIEPIGWLQRGQAWRWQGALQSLLLLAKFQDDIILCLLSAGAMHPIPAIRALRPARNKGRIGAQELIAEPKHVWAIRVATVVPSSRAAHR